MAENQLPIRRVRFTGARTGLSSIVVSGVGRVSAGDVFDAPSDVAERYTALLPTRTGMASDFEMDGAAADEAETPEASADDTETTEAKPKRVRRAEQA